MLQSEIFGLSPSASYAFPQLSIYIEGYRRIYLPINCFDLRSWQRHTVGGADVSRRDGWEERWEELRMVRGFKEKTALAEK
jgi:hypothetical protein